MGRCAICTMPLISKRNGKEAIGQQPPAKDPIGPPWWLLLKWRPLALLALLFTEDIWARQGSAREQLAR